MWHNCEHPQQLATQTSIISNKIYLIVSLLEASCLPDGIASFSVNKLSQYLSNPVLHMGTLQNAPCSTYMTYDHKSCLGEEPVLTLHVYSNSEFSGATEEQPIHRRICHISRLLSSLIVIQKADNHCIIFINMKHNCLFLTFTYSNFGSPSYAHTARLCHEIQSPPQVRAPHVVSCRVTVIPQFGA
jgi:hypothetical protein